MTHQLNASTQPSRPTFAGKADPTFPFCHSIQRSQLVIALLLAALALGMAACGNRTQASDEAALIRTPRPTFTPTAAPATATPAAPMDQPADPQGAAPAAESAAAPAVAPLASTGARAVVNSPLVNARKGPDVSFDVIAVVERGQEFDILGKNAAGDWWYVCCVDGATAWISDELVDTDGPVDAVAVTAVGGAAPPAAAGRAATPVATAAPAGASAAGAAADEFTLIIQEQFPEEKVVRLFGYILQGDQALADYTLRVRKDGAELPVAAKSFGGQPGFTWPFADPRQRLQNLKVEFPGVEAGGVWEVQLVDGRGAAVGPPATFQLKPDEANQELYVRYERP